MAQNPLEALRGSIKGSLGIPQIIAEKVRRAVDAAREDRRRRREGIPLGSADNAPQNDNEMPVADAVFKKHTLPGS